MTNENTQYVKKTICFNSSYKTIKNDILEIKNLLYESDISGKGCYVLSVEPDEQNDGYVLDIAFPVKEYHRILLINKDVFYKPLTMNDGREVKWRM